MSRGQRRRRGLGLRGWLIVGGLIAVMAGFVAVARDEEAVAEPDQPTSLLDRIPGEAILLVDVDLAALRASPIGERFLGKGRNIAGLGEVDEVCGADPMASVDRLFVVVPGADSQTGFGVFAFGPLRSEVLMGCATRIVSARGGKPVVREVGDYRVLKDTSLPASSAELAVADGGPVVLAEPDYVQAALTLSGDDAISRDERHTRLRAAVQHGTLVATAVLSGEQRRTLRDELRQQRMADSPLGSLHAAALSIRLGANIEIHGVLRCDSAEACAEVAELVAAAKREEALDPAARVAGISELLNALDVTAQGDGVHIRGAFPAEQALAVFDRIAALRQLSESFAPNAMPERVRPQPALPLPTASVPIEAIEAPRE